MKKLSALPGKCLTIFLWSVKCDPSLQNVAAEEAKGQLNQLVEGFQGIEVDLK